MEICSKQYIILIYIKLIILIFPVILYQIGNINFNYKMLILINMLWTLFFDASALNILSIILITNLLISDSKHFYWIYLIWNILFTMHLIKNKKMSLIFGLLHNLSAFMYSVNDFNPNISDWANLRALSLIPFLISLIIYCK